MQQLSPCTSCSGRSLASAQTSGGVRPQLSSMDSITSRSSACLIGRRLSHSMASTSGRDTARRLGRSRLQIDAALFEPPPFQPSKLSVQYLPGAAFSSASLPSSSNSTSPALPRLRRYTLTHNDITGALQLSIGSDYNQRQVQGFYTRILRDEITAEWLFGRGGPAPAELHIYCHVSGEERWLAPPQLRNFIFRREMTLVLDTFLYADKQLMQSCPDLLRAKVYVHFQSDVQDLDLREYWGVLGDRATWRRMPKGVLARLKLLLFGFPALPHSRPRHALTALQQQHQQQQQVEQLVPAAATAAPGADSGGGVAPHAVEAAGSSSSSGAVHQQWQPQAELAVESTRPVALSLQEQRQAHPQQQEQQLGSLQLRQEPLLPSQQAQQQRQQQQQQSLQHMLVTDAGSEPCSCCCDGAHDSSSADASSNGAGGSQQHQQQCQQLPDCSRLQEQQVCQSDVAVVVAGSSSNGVAATNGNGVNSNSSSSNGVNSSSGNGVGQVEELLCRVDQEQQWQVRPQQRLQEQLGQLEQAAMIEALIDYGRWSARDPQQASDAARVRQLVQASATSSSGSSVSAFSGSGGGMGANGSVLSAAMLGGPSALQLVLQQQQEQMLLKTAGCAAVVMATANAVVDASSSTAGRCQ